MGRQRQLHVPVHEANARYQLHPSKPLPAVLGLVRLLAPAYARFALKFRSVKLCAPREMLDAFHSFEEGRIRLILAFRHPYGEEPQLLHHVFDSLLPRVARKMGQPFRARPHVRFLHGYEVALWGDPLIRWILPRTGAMPIHHLQADPAGMKAIREVLRNGPHPIALAPEGQVSYQSGTVPRLESGTARMAFWCARDIDKDKRQEKVIILPISVHYNYRKQEEGKLSRYVHRLEKMCGMKETTPPPATVSRDRLLALESHVLGIAENYYGELSCSRFTGEGENPPVADPPSERVTRQRRWDALIETALETGERLLGISPPSVQDIPETENVREALINQHILRVYRIRREGWERVFPKKDARECAPIENALRHRKAGEAWYAMRHMEFVDIASYLDANYLDAEKHRDTPSFDRLVETAINLDDLIHRLQGGNITNRSVPFPRSAVIRTGSPIDVTDQLPLFRIDMRRAVAEVTDALKQSFLECIDTGEDPCETK